MDIAILFQNYLFDQKTKPSVNTVRNYLADINYFIRWLKASYGLSFQPASVTFLHIKGFVKYLTDQNLSPATIERRLSSLRKFFEFLLSIHLVRESPLAEIKAATAGQADANHLGEFKNFLYRQGLAANTIKNYLFDLEHFFSWLSQAVYEYNISVENISEYKNRLLNILKLSPASINRKLSSLRLFCKFAKEQGYLKTNPFDSEEITSEELDVPKTDSQIYQEPQLNPGWFDKLALVKLFDYLFVRPIDIVIDKINSIDISKNSLVNVKKDFYSPHKKTIFIPYIIPLLLLIMTAGFLFGLERIGLIRSIGPISQIGKTEKSLDPSTSLRAQGDREVKQPAGFTFSGKLTDKNGTAVNKTSLVIFSFYEDSDSFNKLLYQTSKEVTPDEQGFFQIILTSVPPSILESPAPVYLGIAIQGDAEMRPRQVANSSTTLAGRLLFDDEGKLTISNDSPSIIASSGTFTLTGQSIAIRTAQNSNSSILLWPDGEGKVDVLSPLTNSITGRVEIADSLSINSQGENDALLVQIGGKPAFAIDNAGNTITNGALSVAGVTSTTSLSVAGDASILGSLSNLNTGGLYAIWYDDTATVGNFKGRPIKQTVLPQINLANFSPASGVKEYSLQIVGYIRPKYSESYTFYFTTSDGLRVFLNQNKILDNWQNQTKTTHQASLYLDRDRWYSIIIEHFQDETTDELSFEWESSSQSRQIVPSISLAYSLSDIGPRRFTDLRIEKDLSVGKNLTVSGSLTVQTAETTLQLSATQASQRLCGTHTDATAGSTIIRDCGSTQTDLAEYYGSDGTLTPGDLVVIDKEKLPVEVADPLNSGKTSSKAWIQKSPGVAYQKEVIGIVSTNPSSESLGRDLFSSEEYPVAVGLSGRVPVKVSTENGPIEVGDFLTSSSVPGVAMKATRAGVVVGKALEGFNCHSGLSRIDSGVADAPQNDGSCQGKVLVFISVSWYNPQFLFTADGQLIVQEATYSGLLSNQPDSPNFPNLPNLIIGSLKARLLDIQQLFAATANIGTVKTNIISPLASDTIIVDGKLDVKQQLTTNSLTTNEATVEGTLRAKKIIAEQIEGLESRLATIVESVNNETIEQSNNASSSSELRLDKFFATSGSFFDGLISLGPTGLSDLSITGILSLGSSFILHDNSINVLGSDLKLQSLAQGGVSLVDGKVYIDSLGNLRAVSAAIDSLSTKSLLVKDELIATGSAQFAKLTIPPLVATASADSNSTTTSGSVGKASILGGTIEVTVKTAFVTENSLIYLTPTSDTRGLTLYVARQIPDQSFTVAIGDWINKDITFNWWIIN